MYIYTYKTPQFWWHRCLIATFYFFFKFRFTPIFNNGIQKQLTITKSNKSFFPAIKIEIKEKLTNEQTEFLEAWSGDSVMEKRIIRWEEVDSLKSP